jgi:hypothetical protein
MLAADLVIADLPTATPVHYVEWFMQRYGAPKASIAAL